MKGRKLLQKLLRDVEAILPMPHVIEKVMTMTQDPDVSVSDLQRVITLDQALTANVLKLCNSAYYGLPRTVGSVSQAVTYLGFRTIRNLVLSTFLSEVYGGGVAAGGAADTNGLWRHSVATAVAAQQICERLGRPDAHDLSFTGGLLHDVGKTVLRRHAKEALTEIEARARQQARHPVEVERDVLGFDHAALGAKIADTWNFPPVLVQAIGLHHHPEQARGDRFLTHVAHVANHLAITFGAGREEPEAVEAPLARVSLDELRLKPSDVDQLQECVAVAYQKASPFCEMAAPQ